MIYEVIIVLGRIGMKRRYKRRHRVYIKVTEYLYMARPYPFSQAGDSGQSINVRMFCRSIIWRALSWKVVALVLCAVARIESLPSI